MISTSSPRRARGRRQSSHSRVSKRNCFAPGQSGGVPILSAWINLIRQRHVSGFIYPKIHKIYLQEPQKVILSGNASSPKIYSYMKEPSSIGRSLCGERRTHEALNPYHILTTNQPINYSTNQPDLQVYPIGFYFSKQ